MTALYVLLEPLTFTVSWFFMVRYIRRYLPRYYLKEARNACALMIAYCCEIDYLIRCRSSKDKLIEDDHKLFKNQEEPLI